MKAAHRGSATQAAQHSAAALPTRFVAIEPVPSIVPSVTLAHCSAAAAAAADERARRSQSRGCVGGIMAWALAPAEPGCLGPPAGGDERPGCADSSVRLLNPGLRQGATGCAVVASTIRPAVRTT